MSDKFRQQRSLQFLRSALHRGSFSLILSFLAFSIACTSDGINEPLSLVPTLTIVPGGGENQTGQVGTTLPLPLIVQVTGVQGNPNGHILNFVVTSGGGSVFANVVQTGVPSGGPADKLSGIGQNRWTLGPIAGPQTLEARLVDPKSGAILTEATFHATAVAGSASTLKLSAGDKQTAIAGNAVGIPPAVLVTDQAGNPLANVTVTFSVASGGGSITGATSVLTGANGIAAVNAWVLGTLVGPNTLTATATGLTGSPLTFAATGVAGPATQIVRLAGHGQRAETRSTLLIPPAVQVRDAHGNAVTGVAVTFTVMAGGGSMDGIGSVTTLTNQSGTATVGWTVGSVGGANSLRATALGLSGSPVTFGAVAFAPLYVANQDNNSITIYDPEANGNASPIRTISGANTGLSTPANLIVDGLGQLYVSNYTGGTIAVFAWGASGNATPIRTISGPNTGFTRPFGLELDHIGQLYVFDYANKSIRVFAPEATGDAVPVRVITGGNPALISVTDLKLGPGGELYVADQDAATIKIFAAGANGNVAPVRSIAGPSTGLSQPGALHLDASGLLYVTNFNPNVNSITVYAPGANGDVAPIRTIVGPSTNLFTPTSITADHTGLLYVSNYVGQSVTVFAANANGNAVPLRTIAGPATGLIRPGALTF
jgi:6-phosphogluconolactonase (cycloisomerase 2 family)